MSDTVRFSLIVFRLQTDILAVSTNMHTRALLCMVTFVPTIMHGLQVSVQPLQKYDITEYYRRR